MHKYKNISGKAKLLIGVGVVESDEIVETDVPVSDPDFIQLPDEE